MKVEFPELLGLAREDLACYCVAQYPQFELAAHHRLLVDKLEAVERGEIRRLMLFLPPRHGKSLLTTQFLPAWYLGLHPDRFVISASYGQDLADDFGRKVRNLIADPLHAATFAECRLSGDSTSMRRFGLTAGGSYYAVGRGGPITGRGAHLLLIDDPLKDADEARSETVRRSLHEWYAEVAYTRLQPGAAVVLIQTRWHEDDLAGRLLRQHAEDWDVVSLPAIAECDDLFRREGEALWPEHYPLAVLEQIRQAIGSAAWASLYQQRPAAAEGAIVKRDWWKYYRLPPIEMARNMEEIIISWDSSYKDLESSDHAVGQVWGRKGADRFLLDQVRAKMGFNAALGAVRGLCGKWPQADVVVIEETANGKAIIETLQSEISGIVPVQPLGGKVARAWAVAPEIESGNIYLPDPMLEGCGWVNDYVEEWAKFPAGVHDDQVDATTQALLRMKTAKNGLLEFYKLQTERMKKEMEETLPEGSGEIIVGGARRYPVQPGAQARPVNSWIESCASCGFGHITIVGCAPTWRCGICAAWSTTSPDRKTTKADPAAIPKGRPYRYGEW